MRDTTARGDHVEIDLTDLAVNVPRVVPGPERGLVRDRVMGTKLALSTLDLIALTAILFGLDLFGFGDRTTDGSADLAGALVIISTPLLWRQIGLYRLVGGWRVGGALHAALTGAGSMMLVVFTAIVVFQVHDTSRTHLMVLAGLVSVWIPVSRLGADGVLQRRRANGKSNLRVLMVGGGIGGERFLSALRSHPELGMDPIGYVGHDVPGIDPKHRLGDVDDLPEILSTVVVDEVIICLPFEQWPRIRDCVQLAEEQGKTVRMPMWMVENMGARSRLDHIDGVPLLSLVNTPDDVVQIGMKRLIDIIGALIGIVVFAPVVAVAAAAIKLTDGGPVFFRQVRVGLHGREFPILKLRTMVTDAEARLADVAHLNEREAVTFKATDDPRVTRVGRLLRRTSMDEVPQFWNVLTGDMALVGPRPALPSEVSMYDRRHRRRLSVKPGVTGLWQVAGRQDRSFESWVDLDLSYIDEWTPAADLRLLARTVPAVLRGTGS